MENHGGRWSASAGWQVSATRAHILKDVNGKIYTKEWHTPIYLVSRVGPHNMPPILPVPVNYYAILGISPSADITAINISFRRLAWRYHPDRNVAPRRDCPI